MKKALFLALVLLSIQSMAQLAPVPSGSYHWADAPVTKSADRESRKIIEGSTFEFGYFRVHASTQYKGAATRPPHAQKDIEEMIFIKEGTMKFTMDGKSKIMGKGSAILVPPLAMQALENVGDGPLTYYVMQFRPKAPMDMERSAKAGGGIMLNADSLRYVPSARGGGIKYFDRPTAMTNAFEMHITELKAKGPSHAPHTHIDTEMILVIDGETEMLIGDKTFKASAGDIYLMNSKELHGISNSQDKPCRYLAIRWK